MTNSIKKYIAEAIGTFTLVFFGVGSAVLAGSGIGIADTISITGISFAFGISVMAMVYSIGQISGAHLNPAVSMGALVAGRLDGRDFIGYVVGQVVGGIIAAFLLYMMATSSGGGYDIAANGLGQNGWGEGYGGGFSLVTALVFELVATAIFIIVILGATSESGNAAMAGLVIGLTLTMIHLVGITVTGTSVNPARSIGPALFAGPVAISQLWLFIIGPLIGGALGGFLHKSGVTSASTS